MSDLETYGDESPEAIYSQDQPSGEQPRSKHRNEEEEEEEEDEDDRDETKMRTKRRHKKGAARLLDLVAESDDDDEGDDDHDEGPGASLLKIKKQDQTVAPGSWVRIKRGTYQGDLAQVIDITETGEFVGLKFIPRIDLNPQDEGLLEGPTAKKKKKTNIAGSGTTRPLQRLFNYEEVVAVWGRKSVVKRNQVYVFHSETFKDGLIEKDFMLSQLMLEDVNPTLDEITQFALGQEGETGENVVNLSLIDEASRKAAISVLQPGDQT
ncbi:hypothetical protein DFH08DRAFT_903735 [Mycena albidolilacea]|uniref:Spt5 KOW domain-containing protein n=1 Tax=Mycena albidolilacea TaxID=1033008 RepID=A0AAD6Z1S8_9AGAR|nr:hypothetical protein DFH08DRAFT_903735 [Mycena albidolilacea]